MSGQERSDTTADYRKTLRVAASPDALFDALTTTAGLSAWWTRAAGSGETAGELSFFMNEPEPCVMRVDQALRPTTVRWTVTDCGFLPDWVGTRPAFDITAVDDGMTQLRFCHHGLTPALDCIQMCIRGWDHFLASLGQYVETGHGNPHGSSADQVRRRQEAGTP